MGKTVTFDFDIASPPLVQAQGTPFTQTSNDVTAYFSSIADPAGFTVKSQESTSLKLSQFSGNYLVDINPSRDILDIKLDSPAVAVNFTFATVELQSDTIPIPSEILLTVYRDNTLVGSTKAYGSFSSDSYPQGVLVFSPVKPFNWMRISVLWSGPPGRTLTRRYCTIGRNMWTVSSNGVGKNSPSLRNF